MVREERGALDASSWSSLWARLYLAFHPQSQQRRQASEDWSLSRPYQDHGSRGFWERLDLEVCEGVP